MIECTLLERLAIRPSRSGRFLERIATGRPFFPQADTAWEIFHRLTKEEVILYLDNRQRRGVNVILGVLIPELDVKSAEIYTGEVSGLTPNPSPSRTADSFSVIQGSKMFYPNRYGDVPLLDDNPTTPNTAYFDHVDWVIQQAAERGIMFWLVATWSRFLNTGWADGPILFDPQNAQTYGSFIGERYPFIPKILGGDANPIWTTGAEMRKRNASLPFGEPVPKGYKLPNSLDLPRRDITDVIEAMAAGITQGEHRVGNDHPFMTYHPCPAWLPWSPESRASAFFNTSEWLTMDATQSGHADCPTMQFDPPIQKWNARASHVPITRMWNSGTVRPVIDLESHYEEAFNGLRVIGKFMWDEHDIRSGAWQSVLSGACGIVYGANVIWQMYDKARLQQYPDQIPTCGCAEDLNWKTSLDLPGLDALTIIRQYFLSLPTSIADFRTPAQDLLVSSEAPSEVQELDGRVDVMRDIPASATAAHGCSSWMIAHSGMGYGFTISLSKAFNCDRIQGEWLDPRDGTTTEIGVVDVKEQVEFSPPTKGSVKCDWVLVLKVLADQA